MSSLPKPCVNEQSRESGGAERNSPKLIPQGLTEIVLVALVVLVIALHLKYLWDVRTIVPHQDEWSLLDEMFRALDEDRVGAWVFQCRNGHFRVPAALTYLVSLRYLALDLTPLKLLTFPVCLAAFLLTAHVINNDVTGRLLRLYLYLGACFVIFSLCLWEQFSVGYCMILSVLFGGVALYYIAKAAQRSWKRKSNLAIGSAFLCASILSSGAGYMAAAAAILLLALPGMRRLTTSRPILRYEAVLSCLACGLGLLAIVSQPMFHVKSRILLTLFHAVLVAGSVASSLFGDSSGLLAQNTVFLWGGILIFLGLAVVCDFLMKETPRRELLPIFSLGLVLFGLFGCVAVAGVRPQLPAGEFFSSRYTLHPSICLLGILLYCAGSRLFLLANVWCLAAASYFVATTKELQVAPYRPAVYKAVELAMEKIDTRSDEQVQATLYFRENTEGVRRVVARMRRDRLNVFRESPIAGDAQP